MGAAKLFDQVVRESGLPTRLAADLVRRACRRVGVHADSLDSESLVRATPAIERAISVFVGRREARVRMRVLASLAL